MGAIKDIVDLAKDLESRAKDRHDMDTIHKIQSLAFSLQSQYVDAMERDVRLIEENAKLKQQLAESNAEEIRFHSGLQFHRSKRTGGEWMACCPKCNGPALLDPTVNEYAVCTACNWISLVRVGNVSSAIARLKEQGS